MNATVRSMLRGDRDPGDLWGWCQLHRFGIANALDAHNDHVPARWEYRPGAGAREDVFTSYPDFEWFDALTTGAVTAADLIAAGDILERYARVLVRAGRDY